MDKEGIEDVHYLIQQAAKKNGSPKGFNFIWSPSSYYRRLRIDSQSEIFYYGRPLLKYETFPYPIYDVEEKVFKYMKVNSNEFELVHEKTKPLTKFKGLKMK